MPDREQNPGTFARTPTVRIARREIQSAQLRKALDLWTRLKGERPFPARNEITPRDLTDFLRNIVLVRVLDNGEEFQFRIVGDAIVLAQGQSCQGMTTVEIDEQIPGYGTMVRGAYKMAYAERKPVALRGWYDHAASQRAFFHETMMLPLGPDAETIDHILVVAVFAFSPDGAPG